MLGDLGVERRDVDGFVRVLGLDVRADRDVVAVLREVSVRTSLAKWSASSRAVKASRIFCWFASVSLFLLPDVTNSADASMNRTALSFFDFFSTMMQVAIVGAEEEIRRQLDHRVDVVVVNEVLADLLLGAAAVENAGELNDRRSAVHREPAEHVHREGEVGLRLRREHAGRRVTRVVDKQRVAVARPVDRVGRIGDDRLERFVVPVRGVESGCRRGRCRTSRS